MKKFRNLLLVGLGMFLLVGCEVEKEPVKEEKELKIGQVQYAAHGTKSFANTTVVLEDDKIVKVYIDEYQYMTKEGTECVPNSDGDFGAAVANQTTCLVSKRVNNEVYSENMKTKGNATKTLLSGYIAIEEYVTGKTIAELETAITDKEATDVVDTVAGSTLVDTKGYIESIIEAAKVAK